MSDAGEAIIVIKKKKAAHGGHHGLGSTAENTGKELFIQEVDSEGPGAAFRVVSVTGITKDHVACAPVAPEMKTRPIQFR